MGGSAVGGCVCNCQCAFQIIRARAGFVAPWRWRARWWWARRRRTRTGTGRRWPGRGGCEEGAKAGATGRVQLATLEGDARSVPGTNTSSHLGGGLLGHDTLRGEDACVREEKSAERVCPATMSRRYIGSPARPPSSFCPWGRHTQAGARQAQSLRVAGEPYLGDGDGGGDSCPAAGPGRVMSPAKQRSSSAALRLHCCRGGRRCAICGGASWVATDVTRCGLCAGLCHSADTSQPQQRVPAPKQAGCARTGSRLTSATDCASERGRPLGSAHRALFLVTKRQRCHPRAARRTTDETLRCSCWRIVNKRASDSGRGLRADSPSRWSAPPPRTPSPRRREACAAQHLSTPLHSARPEHYPVARR